MSSGHFKISDVPLAPVHSDPAPEDPTQLPSHYGAPLLLAIPRNPSTLFLCWSVDWMAAFGSDLPIARKTHVKLTSRGTERTQAVEPLGGYCFIDELEAGETYGIEIGYYAPSNQWKVIAATEAAMPLHGAGNEDNQIEVATIPFHLSFQRLTELFQGHVSLAHSLAAFEGRMANDSTRSEGDEKVLRELRLSPGDLKFAEAIREGLKKSKTRPRAAEEFFGSSFPR
jgi:hypothetical protein